MPLTELVNYLNGRSAGLPAPFSYARGRVQAHFADLQLESHFLPIVDTANGQNHGHAAVLQAYHPQRRRHIDTHAVFVLPSDDAEFIQLDRLVRTLHALNYLTHRVRGNLLLKVHPRHVLSVPTDHGLAFEEILRPCGLVPAQITLELEIDDVDHRDHLLLAARNYRQRGYRIAIDHFGRRATDFALLAELQPHIVRLDQRLLGTDDEILAGVVERLRQLGAKTLIEGVDTTLIRRSAAAAHIDLLQAHAPLRQTLVDDSAWGSGQQPAAANLPRHRAA
jgi:EAL domain-containing protein (putative c-di-GMP-specific phosphodiesterase class I)